MAGDLSTTLYNPYQLTGELDDIYFTKPLKIKPRGVDCIVESSLGRLVVESEGVVFKEVLKYLEPRDLVSMRRVCVLFYNEMLKKAPELFLVTQKSYKLRNGWNQSPFLTYPSLHVMPYQFTVEDPHYFYPNRDFYIDVLNDIREIGKRQKVSWHEEIDRIDPRRAVYLMIRFYFQEFLTFTKGRIFSNDDFEKLNLLQWWYLLRPRDLAAEKPWALPRGGFLALWQYNQNGQTLLGAVKTPYRLEDVSLFKPAQLKALTDVVWYNLLTCCDWSTIVLSKQDTDIDKYHDYEPHYSKWVYYTGPQMYQRRVEGGHDYFSHDFFRMLADFEADELSALGFILPFYSFIYGTFYKDGKYSEQAFPALIARIDEYEAEKRTEENPTPYTMNHIEQVKKAVVECIGNDFKEFSTFAEFLRVYIFSFNLRNRAFLETESEERRWYESLPFFPQAQLAYGLSEAMWKGIDIVETVTAVVTALHSMRNELRGNAQNHCSFVPNFFNFYDVKKPAIATE